MARSKLPILSLRKTLTPVVGIHAVKRRIKKGRLRSEIRRVSEEAMKPAGGKA